MKGKPYQISVPPAPKAQLEWLLKLGQLTDNMCYIMNDHPLTSLFDKEIQFSC